MTYPRKTTASLAADYIFVAACLAFAALVLGLFFLVFALGDLRLSRTDPIAAEVVDKTTQTQLVSSKRGVPKTRLVNWVELQVTQSSGQVTRFGLGPDAETYANLRLGQKVLVRFNPSNPLSSVLDSAFRAGKLGLATRFLAVGAAVAMIGSAVLILWGRARAQRLIGARDQGFERRAVVIAHKSSFWRGGKYTCGWSAVWRDEEGQPGRTFWRNGVPGAWLKGVPAAIAPDLPPVGGSIRVYVDRHRPGLSVWEGDIGSRIEGFEPQAG